MARLGDITTALDQLLEPGQYRDYGPNGLQVPPPDGADGTISTVATAVSADGEALEAAAELGADLVLVHHGLFWDGDPRALDGVAAARLRTVLGHRMALAAYHLPLDGHPELGNNALLCAALGAESTPWDGSGHPPVGSVARFDPPVPADELLRRVERVAGQRPVDFRYGPELVARLAVVSGAAASMLPAVAADGLDGLLTGEPREQTRGLAREHGLHAICAGHHATERLGVQALGEWLAERFGVRHHFVETHNPI
ncbi:MAG: Nif3-like dinuclear metal center hexameric protein [Patulibacter sp.]|nr:Nif3-like dinuclear metal center hexameric protein [Patulibacter sp.]